MSTKQIGSVVGIERMDTHDRAKLRPEVKLCLLCDEAIAKYGRDPRSENSGFALVARPRVVLQLLIDAQVRSTFVNDLPGLRLQRAMVLSTSRGRNGESVGESDIVGWWRDVPIAVRSNVHDDQFYVMPMDMIPNSKPVDRRQAGRLRMAAHSGRLETLREPEN